MPAAQDVIVCAGVRYAKNERCGYGKKDKYIEEGACGRTEENIGSNTEEDRDEFDFPSHGEAADTGGRGEGVEERRERMCDRA